jgi:ADP-ribose pyrophosphatase
VSEGSRSRGRHTRAKKEIVLSPWVRLIEREVAEGDERRIYHSLRQDDYVAVLAVTPDAEVVVVEQYRPAVDATTLELPAGLLSDAEDPAECALRELHEETGWRAASAPRLLGKWRPDTGRLENHLWAYYVAAGERDPRWRPEPYVTPRTVAAAELKALVAAGRFDHALHLAVLGVAAINGLLPHPF